MYKSPFQSTPGDPPPLRGRIKRVIRFEEVDSVGIVWHGRYPSFFEEGRVALGHNYGVSYSDFIRHRCPVPIRQLSVDYFAPLQFEDEIEIETILYWSEAAKMSFEYLIHKGDYVVCAGHTIQLMIDDNLELLLAPPAFYVEFMEKWKKGLLS